MLTGRTLASYTWKLPEINIYARHCTLYTAYPNRYQMSGYFWTYRNPNGGLLISIEWVCQLYLRKKVSFMFYKNTAKDLKKKLKRGGGKGKWGNHWETINVFKVFTLIPLKRKRVNSESFLVKKENKEKKHILWTNVISKYSLLLWFKPTKTKCVFWRLVQPA